MTSWRARSRRERSDSIAELGASFQEKSTDADIEVRELTDSALVEADDFGPDAAYDEDDELEVESVVDLVEGDEEPAAEAVGVDMTTPDGELVGSVMARGGGLELVDPGIVVDDAVQTPERGAGVLRCDVGAPDAEVFTRMERFLPERPSRGRWILERS